MDDMRHYARTVPYDQLVAELMAARAERLVYWKSNGPLQLWCYTAKAVYDRGWFPAVMAARGLVLDCEARCVVATAFPKFFNLGEHDAPVPDEACEVFEKVDGSLIVIFHDGVHWRTATKGALDSAQALWAARRLADTDLSALVPGTTYLAEAIYPENRIVVRYDETGLVLLAAYKPDGFELGTTELEEVAAALDWRMARRQQFATLAAAITHARDLPESEEGYVLRFASGRRLKLKGAVYARIHAIIARVTPLGLWDAMAAGEDLDAMRRVIPEEYWDDFDRIRTLLAGALNRKLADVAALAAEVAGLSDKELGLRQRSLPQPAAGYLFRYRQDPDLLGHAKTRQGLLRAIRPTGDVLAGYEPSWAMRRMADEG